MADIIGKKVSVVIVIVLVLVFEDLVQLSDLFRQLLLFSGELREQSERRWLWTAGVEAYLE